MYRLTSKNYNKYSYKVMELQFCISYPVLVVALSEKCWHPALSAKTVMETRTQLARKHKFFNNRRHCSLIYSISKYRDAITKAKG